MKRLLSLLIAIAICMSISACRAKCEEHSYGDWSVKTAASCTTDGIETRECSICGATEDRTLNASGHNFSDWSVKTATTCITDGIETRKCSSCDAAENREVKSNGHQWVPATCTSPKKCNSCNATEGSALGHANQNGVCSRCNANMTPTVSFSNSYKNIYNLTISGSTITIGTSRGVLDDMTAKASVKSDGTCNIELTLKGKVERIQYTRASFGFFIYIYDADGNQVNERKLFTTKSYTAGEDIAIYTTIFNLPYSSSYTVTLREY